eukprot:gene2503-4864_t
MRYQSNAFTFVAIFICYLTTLPRSVICNFETDGIPISVIVDGNVTTHHLVFKDISILGKPDDLIGECKRLCQHYNIIDEQCSSKLREYITSYDRGTGSYTPSEELNFMFQDTILIVDNFDKKMKIKVPVGKGTYGQPQIHWMHANFTSMNQSGLSIGRFCSIAPGVKLWLDDDLCRGRISNYPWHHRSRSISRREHYTVREFQPSRDLCPLSVPQSMTIGNDVWIAASANILSGVQVGDGAIIGAFAVVYTDVEPYSIVVGNPAVHIGYRFEKDIIQQLLKIRWWDWSDAELDDNMDIFQSDDDPMLFLDRAKAVIERRNAAVSSSQSTG